MLPDPWALLPVYRRLGRGNGAPVALVGHAIVDADLTQLARLRWGLASNGRPAAWVKDATGRPHLVTLCRVVLGLGPGDPRQALHRHGHRLDCRRCKLEIVQPGDERLGRHRGQHRGHRAARGVQRVGPTDRPRWRAVATVAGVRFYLGEFADPRVAQQAVERFRRARLPHCRPDDKSRWRF